jgi:Fe-S-cluster containining protein
MNLKINISQKMKMNLKDNLCINYDHRPKDCSSYPHLHKNEFLSRTWGVIDNYSVCPIVFNTYEILKIELLHYNNNDLKDFDVYSNP